MMNLKPLALSLALAVGFGSLAGCASFQKQTPSQAAQTALTYTVEAASVAAAVEQAQGQLKAAELAIQANKSQFSQADWDNLVLIDQQLNLTVSTINNLVSRAGGSAQILINGTQLLTSYSTSKAAFEEAVKIITPHESAFNFQQVANFQALQANMTTIDTAVQQLTQAASGGQNITPLIIQILSTAALVAKVAVGAGA